MMDVANSQLEFKKRKTKVKTSASTESHGQCTVSAYTNNHAFLVLPETYCSSVTHLRKLIEIRNSIQSKSLGVFLDTLFSNLDIALPFIQLPASIHHHHSIKSGLLIHSVEVAMIAAQLEYESTATRDITVVAALLHDIGKIRSYTTDCKSTNLGKMVSHDQLTLEICASALSQLDKDWPDAANTLRHIWTCASPGNRYGFQPCTPLANIVRFADKFSADKDDHKNAFKDRSSTFGFAWKEKDKKYLWKAANEKIKQERRKICF